MSSINTTFERAPGRTGRNQRGFTLIEAALATVIIGTGVLAIVLAQQAFCTILVLSVVREGGLVATGPGRARERAPQACGGLVGCLCFVASFSLTLV